MSRLFNSLVCAALFMSCNSSGTSANSQPEYDYHYVPLKEFKYKQASIQPGTEVQLLTFSGGLSNRNDTVFYYQFIVIDKTTGDTVRILTPLISVEGGKNEAGNVFTSPLIINPDKAVNTALYELPDSSQNLMLQIPNMNKTPGETTIVNVDSFLHPTVKEFVIISKTESKNSTYKTAIGTLHFTKMPW